MLKKKDPILKISTRVYYNNAFKNKAKRLEGKYKYAKNRDYNILPWVQLTTK